MKLEKSRNLKAISKRCFFVLVTWPRALPDDWPEMYGGWSMVGVPTLHGFDIDLIKNPTIWLAENQNQVNRRMSQMQALLSG